MSNDATDALPDLEPLALPAGDEPDAWHNWLSERADQQLQRAAAFVERLKGHDAGDPAILGTWNDVGVALANAFAAASLMAQVHPEQAVRERAEQAEVTADAFRTDLMLDAVVYDRLSSLEPDHFDADGRRVLEHTLRDFRRAGVDREHDVREQLRSLAERATQLGQTFSRGIRDGRLTTYVDAAALEGLPEDWKVEHPVRDDGTVAVTTDYPDTYPFLTFSRDPDARRAVATSFRNIAWPDNDPVLGELLRVRAEQARVLGYPGWADYDAEVKMIGSAAAIAEFIDKVAADAEESGRRDLAVVLERARADRPELEAVDNADLRFYEETVRREQLDVDAQEVRAYFEFAKVRQGLLDVTGRLFGLTYEPVVDAPVWHPEVTAYDVSLDGDHLGRIYLDLHPRDGKYNHAAQFDLVPGVLGEQLPEGVLVCNFPRGLMEHGDVVTLFHEFGHLMHHVLAGRHRWVRFSGVATEWDFVEAPSQMLEEWAWDAGVLRSFATDAEGRPIPAELVAKMRAAEEFGKGYLARTQMFYAAVSYRLHEEQPDDISARVEELGERYNLVRALPDTHFHTSFGHLEGYGPAYYTYMWSLVIAKDLFSAFDPDDLLAPEVARRYRDTVLAAGGSRDAADLVEEFLGRPYTSEAFRAWLER